MAQVLDQPLLNTPLVDGVLVDKSIRAAGMDGQEQDVATINTMVYDKPVQVAPQSSPVIVPIA